MRRRDVVASADRNWPVGLLREGKAASGCFLHGGSRSHPYHLLQIRPRCDAMVVRKVNGRIKLAFPTSSPKTHVLPLLTRWTSCLPGNSRGRRACTTSTPSIRGKESKGLLAMGGATCVVPAVFDWRKLVAPPNEVMSLTSAVPPPNSSNLISSSPLALLAAASFNSAAAPPPPHLSLS
nr:hypothetical protein Iba_chr12aCG16230 [Ipomoea batatas]